MPIMTDSAEQAGQRHGDEREELRAPPDDARRAGAEARSLPVCRLVSSKALEKIRDLLSRRIESSGFSLRKLERQLGFATGSLCKMLRGRRKLEVGELLILLVTLDVQAGPFFAEVADEPSLAAGSEAEQEPAT